jgi:pimeloyl-ACP methyl ester carboxylesterase
MRRNSMPSARINGINIEYDVAGQGEPLVMIMGMGFGKKGWIMQTRFLKKYFQVITFDNRGAGNSDKPQGPYSTRMMADDTVGLMDHLHLDKAHILGMSMGGMIAQEIAINYPQRVNKLVLVSTLCKRDETSGDTPEMDKAFESWMQGSFSPVIDLFFNKQIYRLLFGTIMKKAMKKQAEAGNIGIRGQRQACLNHNTANRMSSIESHPLVISGTDDRVNKPGTGKLVADLIPGSKLVRFENGSHLLSSEMSGRFNREVLNFLKHDH